VRAFVRMKVTVSGLYFGLVGLMITVMFLMTPTTGSVTVTVRTFGYGPIATLSFRVPVATEPAPRA